METTALLSLLKGTYIESYQDGCGVDDEDNNIPFSTRSCIIYTFSNIIKLGLFPYQSSRKRKKCEDENHDEFPQ
jgi:hypothetical protein